MQKKCPQLQSHTTLSEFLTLAPPEGAHHKFSLGAASRPLCRRSGQGLRALEEHLKQVFYRGMVRPSSQQG